MAIPTKRHERNTVSYLDLQEIKALLAAPDPGTWLGRRDHALLVLMVQTGVRVSELVGLRVCDIHLGTGAHIRVTGKGRKKRATTLTGETVAILRAWLTERHGQPDEPLFPTRQGRSLSRYTVGVAISKYAAAATANCPSLTAKRVTPHTLRHSNAMMLRAKGVDIATIALWLGTRAPRPRTSTSTPIRRSRSRQSRGPHRSGCPFDTAHLASIGDVRNSRQIRLRLLRPPRPVHVGGPHLLPATWCKHPTVSRPVFVDYECADSEGRNIERCQPSTRVARSKKAAKSRTTNWETYAFGSVTQAARPEPY